MDTPEQAESATPEVSAVQSIWGVLLAPEKTFRALAVRPHWLPALLLLVAAALALSVIVTPRLDMKQVIRDAIEDSGREVSAAQLEQQTEMAEKFKWVGTVSQVVLQPAVYMLMAAIFLVVFRLMGSDIDFRHSLSVAVHGMMPFLLATLLAIPVVLSRTELSMEEVQERRLPALQSGGVRARVGRQDAGRLPGKHRSLLALVDRAAGDRLSGGRQGVEGRRSRRRASPSGRWSSPERSALPRSEAAGRSLAAVPVGGWPRRPGTRAGARA